MRLSRLVILPVSALLLTACGVDDDPVVNARPQLSGVRFIHAMPDEGPVDARMIDATEWHAYALNLNYRGSGITLPTAPGTRPVRVWRASNVLEEIVPLIEADVAIPANQNVTLLLTGNVADGTARIEVITDAVPDSTAGQIHVRALNAGPAAATVQWLAGGVATDVAVGPLQATEYAARPTGALSAVLGGTTFAAPLGTPLTDGIGATAGAEQSGSALTAMLFPASVVGSRAPQGGAFAAPGVVWFVDRVPAPPRGG